MPCLSESWTDSDERACDITRFPYACAVVTAASISASVMMVAVGGALGTVWLPEIFNLMISQPSRLMVRT